MSANVLSARSRSTSKGDSLPPLVNPSEWIELGDLVIVHSAKAPYEQYGILKDVICKFDLSVIELWDGSETTVESDEVEIWLKREALAVGEDVHQVLRNATASKAGAIEAA